MYSSESFKIDLKDLKEPKTVLEYNLSNSYFETINSPEVKKGVVRVVLSIRKTDIFFELLFNAEGTIQIACDHCLDEMDQNIKSETRLVVKYGDEYSEEDDIVTIPEDEGILDVTWLIYEFIALNIPIKHVHAPGKCNREMLALIEKHSVTRSDDGRIEGGTDPRWCELEKLKTIIKD
jgi:uncharacterized metal-binding protein YceD (DUF177 family)